jgi:hypothetical protein
VLSEVSCYLIGCSLSLRPARSRIAQGYLFVEGSDGLVTCTAASTATGWSETHSPDGGAARAAGRVVIWQFAQVSVDLNVIFPFEQEETEGTEAAERQRSIAGFIRCFLCYFLFGSFARRS